MLIFSLSRTRSYRLWKDRLWAFQLLHVLFFLWFHVFFFIILTSVLLFYVCFWRLYYFSCLFSFMTSVFVFWPLFLFYNFLLYILMSVFVFEVCFDYFVLFFAWMASHDIMGWILIITYFLRICFTGYQH